MQYGYDYPSTHTEREDSALPLKVMDIKTVAMGAGPVPSFVVLEQHEGEKPEDGEPTRKPRRLPIRIGSVEAAAISLGVRPEKDQRPKTHDLLKSTLEALDAQLLSVRINKVSGATFYAQLVLRAADGSERLVDARPSDAIALAVRCGVKILAEDSVLEAASMLDFKGVREAEQAAEMAEFHDFVEHVSPEDFE